LIFLKLNEQHRDRDQRQKAQKSALPCIHPESQTMDRRETQPREQSVEKVEQFKNEVLRCLDWRDPENEGLALSSILLAESPKLLV
jgi:hypothetical protein